MSTGSVTLGIVVDVRVPDALRDTAGRDGAAPADWEDGPDAMRWSAE